MDSRKQYDLPESEKGGLSMKEHPVIEWIDLYVWGYTMSGVAALYGVSSYTVWHALMLADVRPRVYRHWAQLRNPLFSARPKKPYLVVSGRDHRPHRVHRVCWEHYHGQIPDGHVIHHVNGDTLDNRLINLRCMTVSEHARLHKLRAFFG